MAPNELTRRTVADPEALWAVLTSKVKVLGPWVKAESKERRFSIGGEALWRLDTKGENRAVVHKWWNRCDGVKKPDSDDYDYGNEDEAYIRACTNFEEAVTRRAGREWVYLLEGERTEYAASKEEALSLADEALRAKGVLLLDRLNAKQMKRYTR